ncbi:MAG: hypothetical protein ACLTDM_00365 [Clostridium butyricum]
MNGNEARNILNSQFDDERENTNLIAIRDDSSEKNNKLYSIVQNNFTINVCSWMMALKDGKIDEFTENTLRKQINENEKIEISIDNTREGFKFKDIYEIKRNIRTSQVQLLQWILYEYNREKMNVLKINISKYFDAKSIKRRKENVDRFFEDLDILNSISFTANINFKGNNEIVFNKLMEFNGYGYAGTDTIITDFIANKNIEYVEVKLADWIERINFKQFVYIDEEFFKYSVKKDRITIMMSLKLSQLVRSNNSRLKDGRYYNCKLKTIFKYLNVSKNDLRKQGIKHYLNIINNSLNSLKIEEYEFGFTVYGNETLDELLETKIYYKNTLTSRKYNTIVRKSNKKTIH